MSNSVDPDQGSAVSSEQSAKFAYVVLSEKLEYKILGQLL